MAESTTVSYFEFISGTHLDRPDGLDEPTWVAITQPYTRLQGAIARNDLPLVIGCAKELVESVAKVVSIYRGSTVASKTGFVKVVNAAHDALERQPGKGLAEDAQIRNIAQGAKTLVSQLSKIRNMYGTGHGHAVASEVADELALVAVDGALLWVRWALRRLHHLIKGSPDGLIRDLQGATFYRGDLTERLAAAQLSDCDPGDQYRIGFSVARRAMKDTFLVMDEGVETCAQATDMGRWPVDYRNGLMNGLFLTADGFTDATPWSIKQVALLLQASGDFLNNAASDLADKILSAEYSSRLHDDSARREAAAAAQGMRSQIPQACERSWKTIENSLCLPF